MSLPHRLLVKVLILFQYSDILVPYFTSSDSLQGNISTTWYNTSNFIYSTTNRCTGWIKPAKRTFIRIYNNSIKIRTEAKHSSNQAIKIGLQKTATKSFATIELYFEDWSYYIKPCTSPTNYSNKLSNVPVEDDKTWILTPGTKSLTITCNEVLVLLYQIEGNRCTTAFKNEARGIKLDRGDTATKAIFRERKLSSVDSVVFTWIIYICQS